MRICMVAWSFYLRLGGSATTARVLSEELVKRGIRVDIIAPLLAKDKEKIKNVNLDKRIEIHWVVCSLTRSYIDFYSRIIFCIKMMLKIRTLSKYIAIFHAQGFDIGFFSTILGTGKPVVTIFGADPLFELINYKKKRCIDYQLFLGNIYIKYLQKIMRILINIFSRYRLTVVSLNENLNPVIKRYFCMPVVNIPAGINIDLFNNKTRTEGYKDIILVVSRLMPWKGIEKAIEVYREVKKYRKGMEIVFIGDWTLKDYFCPRYKQDKGIFFITDLDYLKVIEFYKKASVLLVTSYYETFGITILEAMASRLPVVASDLSVFRDRIIDGSTGFLVGNEDVRAFGTRIVEPIENEEKRKCIINNAYEKVRLYDIRVIGDRYARLYERIVAGDAR